MNFKLLVIVMTVLLSFCFPEVSSARQTVKEPSTGKEFSSVVSFQHEAKDYSLAITGVAVRKKFIFKVYAMAHYMQDVPEGGNEEKIRSILTDNKAKQITMDFVRNVGANKIRDAFREGLVKNAEKTELEEISPLVEQFCGYFGKEVREDDEFIIRWLPGGIVLTTVQGNERPLIQNRTFARVLWSIWFGEKSIVKRAGLVEMPAGRHE